MEKAVRKKVESKINFARDLKSRKCGENSNGEKCIETQICNIRSQHCRVLCLLFHSWIVNQSSINLIAGHCRWCASIRCTRKWARSEKKYCFGRTRSRRERKKGRIRGEMPTKLHCIKCLKYYCRGEICLRVGCCSGFSRFRISTVYAQTCIWCNEKGSLHFYIGWYENSKWRWVASMLSVAIIYLCLSESAEIAK